MPVQIGSETMNILIVDDSKAMRRMIRLTVKDLAERIYECADGSEAVSAYANHLPDWVLMDIRMRKMNGLEATSRIKAAFPQARIVIVTGNKGDDLREAARTAGAIDFVMKDNLMELRRILIDQIDVSESRTIAN
jgi:CheY-like chemotaxis protein